MRRIDQGRLRAPARVIDLEITQLDQDHLAEIDVARYNSIWCLSREFGHPEEISFWDVADESHISPGALCQRGHPGETPVAPDVDADSVIHPLAEITIVICTRNRPTQLRRVLGSLKGQSDADFRVLVVDNAPSTPATAEIVKDFDLDRCEYIVEPRPGLSRARNRALDHVSTELVAWLDDGEVADMHWVRCVKEGFRHASSPNAVCGLMLPAELESEAQVRFEQYGGFNKGRGLSPEVLRAGTSDALNPLYPLPAIGSGGNMAFRVEALRAIGGFDPHLGAGTRTHGGEETRAFALMLRSGSSILHWPDAITWHFHRREMSALHQQFFGYSAGLSAFYASLIRSNPRITLELLKLAPYVIRDLDVRGENLRVGHLPDDFPKSLLHASRKGYLQGAFLYVYEVLKGRSTSIG